MRIGIVGCGTIGSFVYDSLLEEQTSQVTFVFDKDKNKTECLKTSLVIDSLEAYEERKADLVVEAAGQEAVKEIAPLILTKTDLLVVSVGAFADETFLEDMARIARKNNTSIYITPGALPGIEALLGLRKDLTEVELLTRKNPDTLGLEDKSKQTVYDGDAKEACRLFPRNINVAATVALMGTGFERTRVRILSDPDAVQNEHRITAKGGFGIWQLVVRSKPSDANPSTGLLTLLSVLDTIERIKAGDRRLKIA